MDAPLRVLRVVTGPPVETARGVTDPFAAFLADPATSGVLLDVDGTLAPIAAHPAQARVAAATRRVIGRLVGCYALVGVVSGRRAADAAAMVGVAGVLVAGNHGLELYDGVTSRITPEAAAFRDALVRVSAVLEPAAARVGAWVEDKGATLAVHYRQSHAPNAAAEWARSGVVDAAAWEGLRARQGRMVVDIVPPVAQDKGTAARRLVAMRPVRRALYVGDDTTDIDAFAVVDVTVAVRHQEAPDALIAAAMVVVDGPQGVQELLTRLADACPGR